MSEAGGSMSGSMSGSMTFGQALEEIKIGKCVARTGWNGKNMYIFLSSPQGFDPYITMYTAKGTKQPGWLASQADMLADDWLVWR